MLHLLARRRPSLPRLQDRRKSYAMNIGAATPCGYLRETFLFSVSYSELNRGKQNAGEVREEITGFYKSEKLYCNL